MSNDVDNILKNAAANVACETNDEVSKDTLESIKKQLLGLSNSSDNSFVYSLYKAVVNNKEDDKDGKTYVKK